LYTPTRLQALRQQSAQIGPKLSDEEREALAKLVREGVLTMDQLDKVRTAQHSTRPNTRSTRE